jgi:hypothetical protein
VLDKVKKLLDYTLTPLTTGREMESRRQHHFALDVDARSEILLATLFPE